MTQMPPFNFMQWIDDHRDQLKPPVCNKMIWPEGEFIVMVVGGPNQRSDYHIEDGPEFFYQIEGDMLLRTMTDKGREDIRIGEGEIFLLPPGVPHSPQRFENTVGLVIERQRLPHELDGFAWYCERCDARVFDEFLHLENIETQLPPIFDRYYQSQKNRTCNACGHLQPDRQG